MYKLHCERTVASSHRLTHHKGKCKNLHGHNFRILVDIEAHKLIEGGSSDGMVMDFGDIKGLIDSFDHAHLNDMSVAKYSDGELTIDKDFLTQPTAERFAYRLATLIFNNSENIYLHKITVRVYETETQYAEYTLDCD